MTYKKEMRNSKNATSKELLQAALIVAAMLILFWYKETGSRVAAFVFAIIPIVGLLYYLRIPAEKRKKAEQEAHAELRKSTIGKLWIGFIWLFVILSVILIIHSVLK